MTNVSAQDFRNSYENFYTYMRNYLWPYSVLAELAEVEVDIYSAFIDIQKLETDFYKLLSSIKDVCQDDKDLEKYADEIKELLELQEPNFYARIPAVEEVNPEKSKNIRTLPDPYDEKEENTI